MYYGTKGVCFKILDSFVVETSLLSHFFTGGC